MQLRCIHTGTSVTVVDEPLEHNSGKTTVVVKSFGRFFLLRVFHILEDGVGTGMGKLSSLI